MSSGELFRMELARLAERMYVGHEKKQHRNVWEKLCRKELYRKTAATIHNGQASVALSHLGIFMNKRVWDKLSIPLGVGKNFAVGNCTERLKNEPIPITV